MVYKCIDKQHSATESKTRQNRHRVVYMTDAKRKRNIMTENIKLVQRKMLIVVIPLSGGLHMIFLFIVSALLHCI